MKRHTVLNITLLLLAGCSQLLNAAAATPAGKSIITVTQNDDVAQEASSSGAPVENELTSELHALDTVDTTSGNWLLKRAWWEKTEDVYEQLKECVSTIMAMRANFVSQRNESDRTLDVLFSEVGVEQGVLLDTVSYAKDLMDKLKVQSVLTPQEKSFAEKLAGKEREIEQLKIDIKGIDEIDNKIDEALDVFFAQIDTCNKYEHKAWENFKDIARELNDKEARKLYYNTETLFKDVKSIKQYLENDFKQYFDSLLQKAKEHTQKISAQVNALKTEGIDIKKESQLLEKESSEAEKNKIKDKAIAQEKKKFEEAEKKHKADMLKANSLYSITRIANGLWDTVKTGVEHLSFMTVYLTPVKSFFVGVYTKIEHVFYVTYDTTLRLLNIKSSSAATVQSKKDIQKKNVKQGGVEEVKPVDVKSSESAKPEIKRETNVGDKKTDNDYKAPQSVAKELKKNNKKEIVMPKTHQNTLAKRKDVQLVSNDAADDLSKPIDYYEKPSATADDSDLSYYGITPGNY